MQDVAVGAGKLLDGLKTSREAESGIGLLVFQFGFGDGFAANDIFVFGD